MKKPNPCMSLLQDPNCKGKSISLYKKRIQNEIPPHETITKKRRPVLQSFAETKKIKGNCS